MGIPVFQILAVGSLFPKFGSTAMLAVKEGAFLNSNRC